MTYLLKTLRLGHEAPAVRERMSCAAIHSFNLPSGRRRERSPLPSRSPTRSLIQSQILVLQSIFQVPSRTVFTVVEAGQTKSLFADTFESSLEVVAVSDLKSTEINSHRVVYAHVQTNMPSFGVTVSDILSWL